VRAALEHCHHHGQPVNVTPAAVTIRLTTSEGNTLMSDFTLGQPVYASAAVTNAEGTAITGDAGTWSTTAGTISANPNNAEEATLYNAPVGDFTVTYTTANGVVATATGTVVDSTPASASVSLSATAPADEPTSTPAAA
jgi:uncharacterized cupin superfamily protein